MTPLFVSLLTFSALSTPCSHQELRLQSVLRNCRTTGVPVQYAYGQMAQSHHMPRDSASFPTDCVVRRLVCTLHQCCDKAGTSRLVSTCTMVEMMSDRVNAHQIQHPSLTRCRLCWLTCPVACLLLDRQLPRRPPRFLRLC